MVGWAPTVFDFAVPPEYEGIYELMTVDVNLSFVQVNGMLSVLWRDGLRPPPMSVPQACIGGFGDWLTVRGFTLLGLALAPVALSTAGALLLDFAEGLRRRGAATDQVVQATRMDESSNNSDGAARGGKSPSHTSAASLPAELAAAPRKRGMWAVCETGVLRALPATLGMTYFFIPGMVAFIFLSWRYSQPS